MTEETKDSNAIWSHAESAENVIKTKELFANLEYMRDLFLEKLPIGEKRDNIINYFNDIERVISTKEQDVEYERFDDDGSAPEDRQYVYNSATLFKERSQCDSKHLTLREGVDNSTHDTGTRTTVQDQSPIDEHV